MSGAVHLRAYAKINWGLEILGKRPDGYHEIRTVTQTVSLCDQVVLTPADEGIVLRVDGAWAVPSDASNIAWKAAEAFQGRFGVPSGVCIEIEKRIPVGAGLGGGSSDCVAVLAGLARMTGTGTEGEIEALAADLGSDTVLFVRGGAALCAGRGEIAQPIPAPREYNVVVARPDVSVPTVAAYAHLEPQDVTDGRAMDALVDALAQSAEPEVLGGLLRNAFSRRVIARHPRIGELLANTQALGVRAAHMTGSGSAVFGVADGPEHARTIADALVDSGYWACPAHTVNCGHEFTEVVDGE